mmetsp:Transcript_119335/g.234433  ORF Transcript_119335/g.234433 Transcript_119335/m.234433 type:complete len:88 (-) Transcript_119335:359-622(-)
MLVGNGVVGTLSGVLVREEIFAEEVDAELEEGALIVAEGLAVVDFFPLEGSGGRSIRTTDLRLVRGFEADLSAVTGGDISSADFFAL